MLKRGAYSLMRFDSRSSASASELVTIVSKSAICRYISGGLWCAAGSSRKYERTRSRSAFAFPT